MSRRSCAEDSISGDSARRAGSESAAASSWANALAEQTRATAIHATRRLAIVMAGVRKEGDARYKQTWNPLHSSPRNAEPAPACCKPGAGVHKKPLVASGLRPAPE